MSRTPKFVLYPRLESETDFFLAALVQSLEKKGASCSSWARSMWAPWGSKTYVLNWPENLWSDQECFRKKIRASVLRQVLGACLWMQNLRGNPTIMFVHNAKPHNFEGDNFWIRCSGLTKRVDIFYHFTRASVELLKPLLGKHATHKIVKFPMMPNSESSLLESRLRPRSHLILLGVREKRKNLHQFLLAASNNGLIPIIASGFGSSREFLDWCNVSVSPGKTFENVQWLGERATTQELRDLLSPRNKLLLNQQNQLNSGLMWLALSQGAGVIAPKTPSFEEIRDSLPENSLQLFVPPLTPEALEEMMKLTPPGLTGEIRGSHSYDTLAISLIESAFDSERKAKHGKK